MTVPATAEAPTEDPIACACLRLGWRVEQLCNQLGVPEGPTQGYDPDELPGLSQLTSYDLQRLGLDEADFVIDQVAAKVRAPGNAVPNLTADVRSKLAATTQDGVGAQARRADYRTALCALHVDLLTTLSAADPRYGTAYGLGRALADTTRPHQSAEELAATFDEDRIGQLYVWLVELASAFPSHSALAVAQSITWWQQAVQAAIAGTKLTSHSAPASYLVRQAAPPTRWQRMTGPLTGGRPGGKNAHAEPPALESLGAGVARQGQLWLRVLDGEKLCTDLLTPQDYMRAGDRLARRYARLAGQALRAMPWIILVVVVVLVGVIMLLVFISGSAVARAATGVAAIAGALSWIWSLARAQVMPVAAELGKPLWGAELNTASAEAVTVPPLGRPHPGPWETAFKQAGAQAVPVPPPQSVEGPALAAQVPQPAAEPSPEPAPAARLADS